MAIQHEGYVLIPILSNDSALCHVGVCLLKVYATLISKLLILEFSVLQTCLDTVADSVRTF